MDKQKVLSNLRSCLVSVKGKIPINQLSKDYHTLIGTAIPYKSLGFKTLEEFLRSEPSVFTLSHSNGQTFVDAKATEKSSHVVEMVSRQRTSSKKGRKQVRFSQPFHNGGGGGDGRSVNNHSNNRQTKGGQKEWRPKGFDSRRVLNKLISNRPAAVSHNQFVKGPNVNLAKSPMHSKHVSASQRLHVDVPVENIPPSAPPAAPKSRMKIPEDKLKATGHKEAATVNSCPVLSNAKQRIQRKSSEIKESGASDVIAQQSNANTPSFQRTDDPISDLKRFVDIHKLGPIDISRFTMNRQKFHTCQIKIDKHTFNSYPQEFSDAISAERYCAKMALDDLEAIYAIDTQKQRRSLHLSTEKDVLERIPPMIEKHYHGLWVWQLELDYTDKFNETLPVDWLKIIDSSPTIQVEKAGKNYIIRHCNPGDKNCKWTPFMNIHDVSVPANTAQFNDDGQLFAEVTCVLSANEIWCRQIDTKEAEVFAQMEIEMDEFYKAYYTTKNADDINEGGYYVAWFEDGFYRIRAVTINNEFVHCFFIDYGDTTDIHSDYIFKMERKFASCQAQAFVCRLVGLEELYEASATSESLASIYQKLVILEMAPEVEENLNDLSIPVYMYDYETGSSINEELISLLTFESASPSLQKDGITVQEVFISNIESNGDIYIQIHSRGYHSLMELIKNLDRQISNEPPKSILAPITKTNSANRIYFTKSKIDGHYYRVSIIDWSPKGDLAQIYFLDTGRTDVIALNKDILYPLDKLSDVLNQYPAQAVKVRLAIDCFPIPSDFKELVSKELPAAEASVLLKVVRYEKDVALVELFKRNSDGGLFCINKSIELKAKLKEDGNNNNVKNTLNKRKILTESNKNVPSAGFLQRPPLPNKDEDMQVHVPFAVNPWNFFVQPLESKPALNALMRKLQEVYKDVQYSPLSIEDIIAGKIYASKHDDGKWYRTSVIKVINTGSISVFYCDFGYYANLTVQQLLPLDPEFTQLPYQALKAKLDGIKPKQNKWTMDDCDYFKKLVEKGDFYCHLRDIEKDELYDSDIVLKLVLVDTSSEDDIYIGQELIKKGIAIE